MLKIKDMNLNNVIRQGDSQPREYQLDTGNLNLNLTNKSATIRLMTADFQGIGYEATATVSSENRISFSIDDVIPARQYRLEVTVDDYVFPSRATDGQFNIDPSSHGQEVNIIQIIGKDEIVREVKEQIEPFLGDIEQAELDRQAQEEAREETYKKVKDLPEAFQNVIDETTGKDVISAPEIIAARKGKASLGEKIDEVDAQLAHDTTYIKAEEIQFNKAETIRPLVTLIDDDGAIEVKTKLKPFLDSVGVIGCVAIITDHVGVGSNMSETDIQSLHNDGWEIMSHTKDHVHLGQTTSAEVDIQLKESKEYLDQLIGEETKGIVYPYSSISPDVLDVASEYYDYGFARQGVQTQPINSYKITRITIGEDETLTLDNFKGRVDSTIANNGWLVINSHIATTSDSQWAIYQDLIRYIIEKGVEIVTAKEAITQFGNALEIWNEDDGAHTVITKSGKVFADNIPMNYKHKYLTGITASTPLTDSKFKYDRMNVAVLYSNEQGGFPTTSGVLYTFRPRASDDTGFGYQLWYPYVGSGYYKRQWRPATETWGSFFEFLPYNLNVEEIDHRSLSTSIDDYKTNAITYTPIGGSKARADGFPEGMAGMLVTEKMSGEYGYQRQTYQVYATHSKYERVVRSSGSWSFFYKQMHSLGKTETNALVFGGISGFQSKELEVNLGFSVYKDTMLMITPIGQLPKGITVTTYPIDSTNYCIVRLTNTTDSTVSVPDISFNIVSLI